jgi:hypothetical protein
VIDYFANLHSISLSVYLSLYVLSAFLALLIGIVLKLDYFVEVISGGFLLYILLDEIVEPHVLDPEGVVGVVEGVPAFVGCEQGVLAD